ncbi:MAG: alpha/beta hydrolase [Chitinophagaceae bacterium]|nr:alpha/beta hydrolase [Chitinophagaceae bacterium]
MKKGSLYVLACFIVAGNALLAQGTAKKNFKSAEQSVRLSTGVDMNYVEQGDANGIPVILLHGFTDSWHSFEKVLQHLPASLHVFAVSQRGHGNSSKHEKNYHPEDFAKDIAAFIQQKKLGPSVIVGHSMGSTNAQCFAANYPSLTRALVLVASFSDFKKPLIEEFKKTIDELIDPIDSVFIAEFQKSTIVKPIDNAVLNGFINESLKVPAHVWKGVAAGWGTSDFSKALKSFHKPALIMWGDKDAYSPREDQYVLNSSLKNSRLLVYEGIGHALHWEEPERFAADLAAFVKNPDK